MFSVVVIKLLVDDICTYVTGKKKTNYVGTVRKRKKMIMYKKNDERQRGENFGYTDNPVRIRAAIIIIIIICTI